MAVPVAALAGAFAAYQPQQHSPDPIASSLAAYQLQAVSTGRAVPEVAAQASVAQLAKPGALKSHRPASAHATKSGHPARHQTATRQKAAATTSVTCTGTGGIGMLPQNYPTIVNFLVAHGYTAMAAAGIAGNMYQESGGNPESEGTGGGGLIGWTPLPSGFVTGDVAADLQTQLEALLTYNQGWAQYIPLLNAATTPTQAAYVYMEYFERPGLPAAANREGAADAVAQACGITS